MREVLIDLVDDHIPLNEVEEQHTAKTLNFLRSNENCVSAGNLSGHITASAWILSPGREDTLLTHHKKLDRWLQLGGHVEDDATIQDAALREAIEESGINELCLLQESIFDIDVHQIPERKTVPEHYHYDLRFLIQSASTEFQIGDESNSRAWVGLREIDRWNPDVSILRMARKTRHYSGDIKRVD